MDADRDFEMNELVAGDLQRMDKGQRRMTRRRPRQTVPDYVDWKDVDFLRRFVPERGKIMPRRISGISAKDQRRIAQAIKRARAMALLPFVAD
jgi:small subunit ribosomal protein S18